MVRPRHAFALVLNVDHGPELETVRRISAAAIWIGLFSAPGSYSLQRWETTGSAADLILTALTLLLCVRGLVSVVRLLGGLSTFVAVVGGAVPYSIVIALLRHYFGPPQNALALPESWIHIAIVLVVVLHVVYRSPVMAEPELVGDTVGTVTFLDHRNGYSIELPSDWRSGAKKLWFSVTGGQASFWKSGRDATIAISVGRIRPDWINPVFRAQTLRDFFTKAPPSKRCSHFAIEPIRAFAGEANSIQGSSEWPAGSGGWKQTSYGGLVSVVRGGKEYVIQYRGADSCRLELQRVLSTFAFL